jgi:hypothetical protein
MDNLSTSEGVSVSSRAVVIMVAVWLIIGGLVGALVGRSLAHPDRQPGYAEAALICSLVVRPSSLQSQELDPSMLSNSHLIGQVAHLAPISTRNPYYTVVLVGQEFEQHPTGTLVPEQAMFAIACDKAGLALYREDAATK